MDTIKKALQICKSVLFGTAKGTIREPFIDPKEAIRENKGVIKKIIERVASNTSPTRNNPSKP